MGIDKKSVGVVIGLAGVLGLGVVSAQYADIQPKARTFSMTIPAIIPVMQDSTGATIIAKTARLQNNGNDDVVVKSMKLVNGAGYTISSQSPGSLSADNFNISVNGTFANDGTGIYDGVQPKIVTGQSTDLSLGVKAGKFSKGGNLGRIEYEFAWNVVGIQITKKPDKLEYNEGESFDKTGIVVETVLGTGGTGERVDNINITDGDSLTNGQTSVTVQGVVNGQTFETIIDGITVNKKATITGIRVDKKPTNMVYTEGERINKEGMVIRYVMSDGSQGEIVDLSDVQIVDDAPLTAGKKSFSIKVVVNGQTYQQEITGLTVIKATPKLIGKQAMDAALQGLRGKLTFVKTAYAGDTGARGVHDISRAQDGSVYAVVSGSDATIYSSGGVYMLARDGSDDANARSMFADYKCSEIDFRGIDASRVANLASAFSGTGNLTTINFDGVDFSNVTEAGYAFAGSGIKSFDFSAVKFKVLNKAERMFQGSKIEDVTFGGMRLDNLTSMVDMFIDCTNLVTADVANLYAPKLEGISQMFKDCNSLVSVDFSGVDFADEVFGAGLFSNCTSLVSVDFTNSNFTFKTCDRMFDACAKLPNLDLTYISFNLPWKAVYGGSYGYETKYMFRGCSILTDVVVGDSKSLNILTHFKSHYPSQINFRQA